MTSQDVTKLLSALDQGDPHAASRLLPLVREELRRLVAQELPGQTLQPTALVHEAYVRLVGERDPGWQSRGHFVAAEAMDGVVSGADVLGNASSAVTRANGRCEN